MTEPDDKPAGAAGGARPLGAADVADVGGGDRTDGDDGRGGRL